MSAKAEADTTDLCCICTNRNHTKLPVMHGTRNSNSGGKANFIINVVIIIILVDELALLSRKTSQETSGGFSPISTSCAGRRTP